MPASTSTSLAVLGMTLGMVYDSVPARRRLFDPIAVSGTDVQVAE